MSAACRRCSNTGQCPIDRDAQMISRCRNVMRLADGRRIVLRHVPVRVDVDVKALAGLTPARCWSCDLTNQPIAEHRMAPTGNADITMLVRLGQAPSRAPAS